MVEARSYPNLNCGLEPTGALHALGQFGDGLSVFVLKFKSETF